MKAQFIGPSVYVQSETGAAMLLSAQEMIDLVQWGIDNEVALRDRASEANREQEPPMDTDEGDEDEHGR